MITDPSHKTYGNGPRDVFAVGVQIEKGGSSRLRNQPKDSSAHCVPPTGKPPATYYPLHRASAQLLPALMVPAGEYI